MPAGETTGFSNHVYSPNPGGQSILGKTLPIALEKVHVFIGWKH